MLQPGDFVAFRDLAAQRLSELHDQLELKPFRWEFIDSLLEQSTAAPIWIKMPTPDEIKVHWVQPMVDYLSEHATNPPAFWFAAGLLLDSVTIRGSLIKIDHGDAFSVVNYRNVSEDAMRAAVEAFPQRFVDRNRVPEEWVLSSMLFPCFGKYMLKSPLPDFQKMWQLPHAELNGSWLYNYYTGSVLHSTAITSLPPGALLKRLCSRRKNESNFLDRGTFFFDASADPNMLGVSLEAEDQWGFIQKRQISVFRVRRRSTWLPVITSTCADHEDTHSIRGAKIQCKGGATQYILPPCALDVLELVMDYEVEALALNLGGCTLSCKQTDLSDAFALFNLE